MAIEGMTSASLCCKDIRLFGEITASFQVITFITVLLITSLPLNAQVNHPKFERLNIHFPNAETLVRSLHRDSRGYVWFGGFSHIQRYDGIQVKNYRIRQYNGDYNHGPASLFFEDSENNLWMFCNGQILLYDPLYDDFNYLKLQIPVNENDVPDVTAVAEDLNNNLWIK
jgi:ligand-binding sensor domain-containing protein